jgi:hypothetical protein
MKGGSFGTNGFQMMGIMNALKTSYILDAPIS